MYKLFVIIQILILVLVFGLAGCVDKTSELDLEAEGLIYSQNYEANLEKWEQSVAGKSYKFSYSIICYCSGDYNKVEVTVDDQAEIIDVKYFDFEDVLVNVVNPEHQGIVTVEDLFSKIYAKIESQLAQARVTYDEDFGYPLSLYVDGDERIADDETTYKIEKLEFVEL